MRRRHGLRRRITAHSQWKQKLKAYVGKPDGSLPVIEVQADNKCALGQWIYGEGKKYDSLPEFNVLKQEHRHFHKVVADIVRRADAHQDVSKELAVGEKSDFNVVSTKVINAISSMRNKTK